MKKSIGVNTEIFPNPVFIVGTYDKNGKANAVNLAWGGIASSGPESIAIAVRPSRYTHENLLETRAFTINLPSAKYVEEADYFGIVSGRDVDKFEVTGLTPVKGDYVNAPYIEEFPINLECEVTEIIELGVHTLFIGAVKDVKIDDTLVDAGKERNSVAQILSFDNVARAYRKPGEAVAQAFSCGLKYRK
ncbi:MAG: flavin reductase family protein [Clostridiales Family XIII bacterium]|nr:flavin reductase family protein [Clostridiales Family XIII bacterium]